MKDLQPRNPDNVSNTVSMHIEFKFVMRNSMYAIGFLAYDNSGSVPILWGLTNCTPDQLKALVPRKKSRKTTK
jgi:hypothetical protein